jgi:phosphopantetheine adenylyltransferase
MIVQKEEKVIKNSEKILKEAEEKQIVISNFAYDNLLGEYKKLYKRYNKVIKIADAVGNEIMHNNDHLQENLNYTIKLAREKLLHTIAEHRKTKDTIQEYLEKIKEQENEITFLRNQLKWETSNK